MSALYAGSFSESVWFGILREQKYPRYVCTHQHKTRQEARACSFAARKLIQAAEQYAANAPGKPLVLPPGWKEY